VDLERAAAVASAELRFESAPPPRALQEMLGTDPALPYAAALASACPRLCVPLNLLPTEQRQTSSPMVWVPSTALGALVLLAAGATTALPGFENRRYMRELETEIAKVQPAAARAAAIDRDIDLTRKRTLLLDTFRARSKADMDVLAEMTRLLASPAWLTSLDLNGQQVVVTGETDQAAVLLKAIDASPQFEASEFVSPPQRTANGEIFRIRTTREASRLGKLP
jgi:Tfp pilus assembly protein PilN